MTKRTMHDFTVVILDGQFPTGVAITRDMLATAELVAKQANVAKPRWRLCSLDGGTIRLGGGFGIETMRLPRKRGNDSSLWILSGLGLNRPADVERRLRDRDVGQVAKRIRQHVDAGGTVAAACSSVFLLGVAGLLDGRRATTTWWLAPLVQQMFPKCAVDADRMVCADGPLVTSGAAFAQTDLMVHVLRERFGSELVTAICRVLLIDARTAQQATFIVPEALASGDELIGRVTARIEESLPHAPSVTDLAAEFCVSERTLSRRVRRATGKSTGSLIQSVRYRRARTLLENSRMTIEQVAEAVGYRDATALRNLVRKFTGLSPRAACRSRYADRRGIRRE